MRKEWFGMSVDLLNRGEGLLKSYQDGRGISPNRYALSVPQVVALITQYKAINYVYSAYYFIGAYHALTKGANS